MHDQRNVMTSRCAMVELLLNFSIHIFRSQLNEAADGHGTAELRLLGGQKNFRAILRYKMYCIDYFEGWDILEIDVGIYNHEGNWVLVDDEMNSSRFQVVGH